MFLIKVTRLSDIFLTKNQDLRNLDHKGVCMIKLIFFESYYSAVLEFESEFKNKYFFKRTTKTI
jgi:hypothetical protein